MNVAHNAPRAMPRIWHWLGLLLLGACALSWSGNARAQAASDCWPSGFNDTFGDVDSRGKDAAGTITVTCQNGEQGYAYFRICLFMNPSNPSGVAPRHMIHFGDDALLDYDMFADPGYTQIIGSESDIYPPLTAAILRSPGDPAQFSFEIPVYGRIYPGQTSTAGSYTSQNMNVGRFLLATGATPPDPPSAALCPTAPPSGQSNYVQVDATFSNSCFISSASDMDFGPQAGLSSSHDQTSSISLQCPTGTAWRVSLNNGSNADGSNRRMAGPGGHIGYELYRDPGRTQVWSTDPGDVSGTGDNTLQTLTVYGRVPAQAVGAPGIYSDTVTVTLTY